MNRSFGLVSALRLYRRVGPVLCLGLALGGTSAWAADEAPVAHDTGMNDLHRARGERPDAGPRPQPAPLPPPSEPPRAEEPAAPAESSTDPLAQGQDSPPLMGQALSKRTRTKAQARLTGLAMMAARIATQANLKSARTFEAPRDMVNPSERRVLLRRSEPAITPIQPESAPPPATMGVLDEKVVKEIRQRKTMFRMCYESARRRGVTVTRADVKWRLSSDGTVRDVVVEVAQDEMLAMCIRVIASRPFATAVPQEIPVAIPLLFVSER